VLPRVLVDATAVPAERGGVGRYVDGLVGGLSAVGSDLAVVCRYTDTAHYAAIAPGARIVAAPTPVAARPARLAWEQSGLPLVARRVGADVLHCPHYTMPLRPGLPVVVTLHDATFFTEPELHSALKGNFFRWATRAAIRRASRCIVPSGASRNEFVRLLNADPRKLDVAYHGVDATLFHPPTDAERESVASRLGVQGGYVAFLGTLEPRKNVANLVRGWVKAVTGRDDPPALVVAGGSGWDAGVDRAISEVPSHLSVIRPGYLPVDQLSGFLGGALVVVYPSHGEGFGLPVLEAMACSAPVLTTKRLALPEVGGDAVAYTEVDADSISGALSKLLDQSVLRRELASAGLIRAREFTWAKSAEAHLAAYAGALA
jgi:glycosyltransferase involved in cell wall biosynthesis